MTDEDEWSMKDGEEKGTLAVQSLKIGGRRRFHDIPSSEKYPETSVRLRY